MKNVYLISLSSFRILNEKVKEISKEFEEVVNLNLNEVDIDDVINECSYQGLFGNSKLVIVKGTKYFGGKFLYEDDMEKLLNFLKGAESYNIIFLCDELAVSKPNSKNVIALGAKTITDKDITDELKEELLNNYLKDNNITIDNKALDLLKKNSLNNFDILLTEIDKLSLVNNKIDESIVRTYGSVEEDDVMFDFSNAVTNRNFNQAFELLDKIIKANTPVEAIIGLLANSFSNIFMVKDAMSYNLSDEEIAKACGYTNDKRVFVMKKLGKFYTAEDLKNIIVNLSNLDRKIKTGYPPVYGIKEFILSL